MFKFSILCSLFMCFAALCHAAESQDEEKVRGLVQQFVQYWNQNNTKAMASLWSQDGDLINPWGKWGKGRANVEKIFISEHEGVLKNTKLTENIKEIRFLSPDIALIDLESLITNITPKQPGDPTTYPHHAVFILTKTNGIWQIKAARPYSLDGPLENVK